MTYTVFIIQNIWLRKTSNKAKNIEMPIRNSYSFYSSFIVNQLRKKRDITRPTSFNIYR